MYTISAKIPSTGYIQAEYFLTFAYNFINFLFKKAKTANGHLIICIMKIISNIWIQREARLFPKQQQQRPYEASNSFSS